jgi:hypothetical protein
VVVDRHRLVGAAVRLAAAAVLAAAGLWWARHAPGAEGRLLLDLPGGRHVDERDLPGVLLLGGAAFLAATALVPRSPLLRPLLAAVLAAGAVWWWLLEPVPEGRIFLVVTQNHGFTEGDLPGAGLMAVGLVLAASACWSLARRGLRRT